MNKDNTNLLFARYPRLYQGRNEYRMSWGFCCGDGWFNLIDRLSAQIEALCDQLRQEEGIPERGLPMAYEVKECFGSLSFKVQAASREWGFGRVFAMTDALIEMVEEESKYTCQFCGRCYQPGANRTGREWRSPCAYCHGRRPPRDNKENQRRALALDIDGTITADPCFFAKISGLWIADGKEVHIVSSRSQEARRETIAELKNYGISFTALYLLPPFSEAQKLCPHQNLDWFQRHCWLKVEYAQVHGIFQFVDDDPKVLALFSRYAPEILAIPFEDRFQLDVATSIVETASTKSKAQ